ncbi:MAG TPA: alpha/beta hydrolase-fold protein [Polyangiaceae bacterium LLY-WYZ-15_(1-7)]|nr:alpha/beta hydrolase-fold protein [Polyangiaceae bacterium LLY-WYZ-15_(1-7)]HJL04578.1 alpha/beta hydrolase-fold protein [Polyangiaceae bacterium LLY-WYZ-15_(1-7)]HJL07360.1 alpha/beta hydrolase-fold protein [Polyangiaceae bacterium LLY-WYZ-15_(1-7)]HJL21446.1 alpha/beta hydrolase-fold protein [Polyangiaceae bacterium LLY-WYZ-15_(1-7)]HJL31642.1 alpha/beta hydrolase-fold protein [Polyangiaceae bacterium LLY-WYZ-15_(1-7)]
MSGRVAKWAGVAGLGLALLLACGGCADDDASPPDGGDAHPDAGRRDAEVADGGIADGGGREDGSPGDGSVGDAGDGSVRDGGPPDAGPEERDVDALLAALRDPDATAAALDAVLEEVARDEGWPLRAAGRWVFFGRWDAAPGAVSCVGDWNDFTPEVDPAERLASGVHYLAVVEAASDPAGQKWKWHAAGTFRAPLASTAYGYDEFGEHGWVAPPRDASWLARFPGFGRAGVAERTVRLRVPAGFEAGPARVLLLHDGQNVFDPGTFFGGWQADVTLDRAFPDVLAVAVDNGPDRFATYTHTADDLGDGLVGGAADAYLALLEEEVLPFVRARFGVAAVGEGLVVAGSSLGGLVSLYAAQARPELAGCVVGMSSTLGWGAFGRDGSEALVARWSARTAPAIYLDSGGGVSGECVDGDGDGLPEDADDSDNYCVTLQLRDHLSGLGYAEGTDLFHWWEPGAPHNEAAWRDRLERALGACASAGWAAR